MNLRRVLQVVSRILLWPWDPNVLLKNMRCSVFLMNNFVPRAWLGEVVPKGIIVRHIGATIGVDVLDNQRFDWIM